VLADLGRTAGQRAPFNSDHPLLAGRGRPPEADRQGTRVTGMIGRMFTASSLAATDGVALQRSSKQGRDDSSAVCVGGSDLALDGGNKDGAGNDGGGANGLRRG